MAANSNLLSASMASDQSWPIIINSSLVDTELGQLIRRGEYKLKVSDTVQENTCIFPKSKIAFYIQNLEELNQVQNENDLLQRLSKFTSIHQHGFFIGLSPLHGTENLQVFTRIQEKFFNASLNLIPVHNYAECLKCMLLIAKDTCEPGASVIKSEIEKVTNMDLNPKCIDSALKMTGFSEFDISLLQDNMGNLQGICSSSSETINENCTNPEAGSKLEEFLRYDREIKH